MPDPLSARDRVARAGVRAVNWLSRTTGRGAGTVAGGRVGLAIAPDLLARLCAGRTVAVVSGTNGKTTTTALLSAGWGGTVATNATGANMPAGHVAALVDSEAPRVVLESDEAWLAEVVRQTRPRVVVLLNLSRDQLDRASEVRQMAERWRRCFADPATRDLVVVANANDPLVVYGAETAARVRWCDVPTAWRADAASCPKCTEALEFDGARWTSACGFARPDASTTLGDRLEIDGRAVALRLGVPGDFNAANAALALTALAELDEDVEAAAARMGEVREVAGRFSSRSWRSRSLRLVLAKNPAGFAAVLDLAGHEDADLWIAINDRVADGRDPSWLYDVPFERLAGRRVACLGERRLDLATRLDYAGVEAGVVDDLSTLASGERPVWLVANYTAFAEWLKMSAPA